MIPPAGANHEAAVLLDGTPLQIAEIVAVATRQATAVVTDAGRARASASHAYALELSSKRPLYGRTTGVGANREVEVLDEQAHAARLLSSHATSAGPLRSDARVRATLVVRINQIAAGGSGARSELLDALLAILDAESLPPVREYGSIGTGDLSALATIGLALPFELDAHDVLPLLSSNAGAIADAALAQHQLSSLGSAALDVAAASFDAVAGNPEAFSPAAAQGTPFDGAGRVCEAMRRRVRGDAPAARIQDPYGLRALPQVHGAFLDALEVLAVVVGAYSGAAAENPALLPELGVAHHAGFHAAYLSQALDAAVSATAQAAQLSLARLGLLVDPSYTGLPAFLGDGKPGASGVMVCEYIAASALAAMRALSTPAGIQSISLSRGSEDDASFASLAAKQALDIADPYRVLTACELLAAVRALRMLGLAVPERFASLPADRADRDLTDDIERAQALL